MTDDAPLDSAAEADLIALLGSLREETIDLPPHVAARLHEAIAAESAARAAGASAAHAQAGQSPATSRTAAGAQASVSDLSQARERRARSGPSGRRIATGFAALAGVAAAGVFVVGGISLNQPSGDIVAQDASRTSAAPVSAGNAAPEMSAGPNLTADTSLSSTNPNAVTTSGAPAANSGGGAGAAAGGAAGGTVEANTTRAGVPTVEVVSTDTNVAPTNVESTVTTLFDTNAAPSVAPNPVAIPATNAPAVAPNGPGASAAPAPAPADPTAPAGPGVPKAGIEVAEQPTSLALPGELNLQPARYSVADGTFAATSEGLSACLTALGAPASERIEVALVTWADEPAVLIAEEISTGAADQREIAVWVVGTGCSAQDTQLRWASRIAR